MKILLKALKYLFVLIFIILALLFGFLGTNTGYKHLPKIINYFSPVKIEADISGHLFTEQKWSNLQIKEEALLGQFEAFHFHFNWGALWDKKIVLEELSLKNGWLNLPPSSEESEKSASEPLNALPEIKSPVGIYLNKIALENVQIKQNNQEIIQIDDLNLKGKYLESDAQINFQLLSNLLDLNLNGTVQTLGDYPINLSLNTQTKLPEFKENIELNLKEALLNPHLTVKMTGDLIADLHLKGKVDLAKKSLDGQLNWEKIQFQEYGSTNGQVQLSGTFDALLVELSNQLFGKDLPKDLNLTLKSLITPEQIKDLNLVLNSPNNQVYFMGDVGYGEKLNWNGQLKINAPALKDFLPDLQSASLFANIQTSGEQGNHLKALLNIAELSGEWEKQKIKGQGEIELIDNDLTISDLNLDLAGNQLTANGMLNQKNADLDIQLNAQKLHQLLPQLSGAIVGKVQISGQPIAPKIESQLNWQNLAYREKQALIFQSPKGQIQTTGDLKALLLQLNLEGSGKDIPPFILKGQTTVNPEELKNMDLNLAILDGKIDLNGGVKFNPVSWKIESKSQNLNLNKILPELKAQIDAQINSTGKINNNQPEIEVELKSLAGNWQKQNLGGKGWVKIKGNQIDVDDLNVQVGNNQINASAQLKEKLLDLDLDIKAKQLSAFYPKLNGALNLNGKINGNLEKPKINLQLDGKNIAFDGHKVREIKGKIDTALFSGGNLNNHLEIQGLSTGGQNIPKIELKTQGQFQQHQIQLNTTGEYQAQLQMAGGFKGLDTWQGTIQQLKTKALGLEFQLFKPSAFLFSPKEISLKDFCLKDKFSDFCLNFKQNEQIFVDYIIRKISPQSFSAYIPKNIKINTHLTGNGDIKIGKNQNITGKTQLSLQKGNIAIGLDDQAPLNLDIKEALFGATFNQNQAKTQLNIDLNKIGKINAHALISNFKNPHISGELITNFPNISVFKNHVPQVSKLGGKLDGSLKFKGKLDKPELNGKISFHDGIVIVPEYATELKNIRLDLTAGQTGQIDINGQIGTPEGDLKTKGKLKLSPLQLDLNLIGKDMLVANSNKLKVWINPNFDVKIDPNKGIIVNGKVVIPKAQIDVPDTSSGVNVSKDIITVEEQKKALAKKKEPQNESPLFANIGIELGDKVFFKNKDVNIRLKGGLNIIMKPKENIRGEGKIEVASGNYFLYGQELDIRRGRVIFSGNNIANPVIDFLAMREINDVEVGAKVSGTADNLKLQLTAKPHMPDSFILSYLLFGKAPDASMTSDALMEMGANMAIGQFTSGLAEKIHLDVLNISISGLKAGKYLGDKLYIGLNNNFVEATTQFVAKYKFNKRLSVEGSIGQNDQAIDFTYEYEKD